MKRVIVLLITLALLVGMVGCPADPGPTPSVEYSLTISTSEGGEVTTPGEGGFVYGQGEVVSLIAAPASGYYFGGWTGDVNTIANARAASTTITMNGDYSITASFQVIPVARYNLTVSSTEGGSVIAPGQGTFTYDAGAVVDLVAEAEEGYQFAYWSGSVGAVDDINAASTTVTMMGDYTITARFAKEIRTWHDLHAIRDNVGGHYVLVNHLDVTIAGYDQLAGPTANEGRGWEPIGALVGDPVYYSGLVDLVQPFVGSLDGQGYEIRDLFIHRPDEDGVALVGCTGSGAVLENTRVMNVDVTGRTHVGALVGLNRGTVSQSCSTGSVSGIRATGGAAGWNYGTVTNSYSGSSVSGDWAVGGLIGLNHNILDDSYATGSVTGNSDVGGLVGGNAWGRISDSYSRGSVIGTRSTGGLVGRNWGSSVSNSHYNYDEARVNGKRVISVGALFNDEFEQWLANDRFLDIGERLAQEDGWYLISSVSDFRQLLTFGQDSSLKFRLAADLDLAAEPGLYIPYLSGKFDGNGHKISNLSFSFGSVSSVGLVGHLAPGGELTGVAVENVDIVGATNVGGLVGLSDGSVSNCYSGGSVTGSSAVGGLVGEIHTGTLSNSYSSGSVSGNCAVGGLVGWYNSGDVRNCYYDYDQVRVNGNRVITIGALFDGDFDQWLGNDKLLDISERLAQEDGWYLIGSVSDFKQLLAFGQDSSLKFRLKTDLNLAAEPGLYIPYLAGKFDGNGHKISNLRLSFDFVAQVGLFGCIATGGELTRVGLQNAQVMGCHTVGGLVGYSRGLVSHSYLMGSVTGRWYVGGLIGFSGWGGTVRECYSVGTVTAHHDIAGGLVGRNDGAVHKSFTASRVVGPSNTGGLVGRTRPGSTVSHSFWDTQTSRQATSDGGTGKTTAEMKNIATFSGAGWSITAVNPGEVNSSYTWNIVDGQSYPFLSCQSVS